MRATLAALLLIVICAWFTYGAVGKSQFILLDDDLHITHNPHFRPDGSLWNIWKEPYQGLYIPVTYTVWAAQKAIFDRYWGTWDSRGTTENYRQASSRLYHSTNLVLHIANTALVFFILLELSGASWAALLGALFFSLHPVQVEPIAWISGLKDLLSGFFSLAAIHGYLSYSRLCQAGKHSWKRYAWATGSYLLALLSKPSSVVVPLIALALDNLGRGTSVRWAGLRLLPWFAAALPLAWIAKISQPDIHITFIAPWLLRPAIASDALTFYFSKVLVPLGLSPDYGRNPLMLKSSNWRWITWLVPVLLFIVLRRQPSKAKAPFLVFISALAPVLGFVPFYFQEFSTVADRYLYLAMVGPAAGLTWIVARHPRRPILIASALVLLLLGGLARTQTAQWADSTTLFTHAIRVNPNSVLCHNNLGTLREEKGEWLEALYHYQEVIRISPENLAGHYNSGRLFARVGRFDLAEREFIYVLSRDPNIADAQYAYGMVLLRTNRLEEAKTHLFLALNQRPGHAETLSQLGNAFRLAEDCPQALRYFEAALQRNPNLPESNHGKGICLAKQGNSTLAARYFEKAAQREPGWDAPRHALASLSTARATVKR